MKVRNKPPASPDANRGHITISKDQPRPSFIQRPVRQFQRIKTNSRKSLLEQALVVYRAKQKTTTIMMSQKPWILRKSLAWKNQ